MASEKRKSKARIEQSALLPPQKNPSPLIDRDEWINHAAASFVTSSQSNREIYRVILETLWPAGHGIPGPIVDRDSIREAVNTAKGHISMFSDGSESCKEKRAFLELLNKETNIN